MAHTDACKFQVCQFVGKMVDGGLSLREAAKKAQEESDGIPAGTICRWWAEAKKETGERFKNETPPETPAPATAQTGCTGCKLPPQEIVKKIDGLVAKGKSIRDAAEAIAEEAGRKPASVRSAYSREKERQNYQPTVSEAWQFADIAISQLSRIQKDDPGRGDAFQRVKDWIEKNLGE